MATEQQLELSNFIKKIHENLRSNSRKLGVDKAWDEHCLNKRILEEYAIAMKELASHHWEESCKKENATAFSRINWIYNYCNIYFFNNEMLRQRVREQEIALKISLNVGVETCTYNKLKLLDVGSCYNPFNSFACFDVTAIDIAPANTDVLYCDFLNVDIVEHSSKISDRTVYQFQQCSFNVLVFSLFLEYLPSPEQRLTCCKKAYDLLTVEGLLLIITPDSKHVGANAKIMKSWRYILAELGFSRIKYEKLSHIHCMAFRKSLNLKIASRWASLQDNEQFFHKIYIPQDFNTIDNEEKS